VIDPQAGSLGLEWAVERSGGRAVIGVTGELDIATVGSLGPAVRAELLQGSVVLDLSGLSFMDSSGVRLIDTLLREVDAEGWTLTFRPGLQRAVRQVLEMTGMLAVLPREAAPLDKSPE
jgi:anti-sigma B factor antagonist